MENNTYENEFVPETEAPKAPAKGNGAGKKNLILAAVAVVAVVAIIVVLSLLGNTYKTPLKAAEKLLNMKSVEKIINNVPSVLNGFGEKEAKTIIKIAKKSEQYEDLIEDAEDSYADTVEDMKDEYGKNYKITLKVDEKEKLEKDDLKEFRNQLRDVAEYGEMLDDLDSDDYEDLADELGVKKSDIKKAVEELKNFCKDCKSAKVTAGYELSVIMSLNGSELDEPEETDMTIRVFKVDGRWVPDVFSLASEMGLGYLLYSLM